MPTTRKLADLFRAIASDDLGAASSIANEICTAEERHGHRSAARTLRGALLSTKPDQRPGIPAGALLPSALLQLPGTVRLQDVVLSQAAQQELDLMIKEWRERERLRRVGLSPRTKLLFHGPPGCGKSLTARAIGTALGIPAYLVRFDAVIGAYLGQTAIHLRQLFQFAENNASVLILDELDALGKRRGSPLDVGELDRIVIALMQELEHSQPKGLIIGTSNLPRHLDEALWRRFDLSLSFKAPTRTALAAFAKKLVATHKLRNASSVIKKAAREKSYADAESVIIAEARKQTLSSK